MLLCCVTFIYIFICILLHCPLRGPDLIYISLLIIPCIIYYVTNKETLNLVSKILFAAALDDSKNSIIIIINCPCIPHTVQIASLIITSVFLKSTYSL